jgi:uncharacterized protein
LRLIAERVGLDGESLQRTSRLVAKVDSAAVQDGFDLYLHGFIVADDGKWTVVQQGMNADAREARRYHWHSEGLQSFVEEPHAAIEGPSQGIVVNLTDHRAGPSWQLQLALLARGPDPIVDELEKIKRMNILPAQPALPHLIMPAHHDVRPSDVMLRRLHGTLAAAAARGPADFADLLLVPGVGARTVQSLAMVAEIIHGAPYRFQDPARFSLAHGGKDRQPFPVPIRVYDETIRVMKSAVQKAKLGQQEKLTALKRLDIEARKLERVAQGPSLASFVARESDRSHIFDGRSVFGWEGETKKFAQPVRAHTQFVIRCCCPIAASDQRTIQGLFRMILGVLIALAIGITCPTGAFGFLIFSHAFAVRDYLESYYLLRMVPLAIDD